MEKIGNMQIVDNKENKFFCFPMISMACTGSGYTGKPNDENHLAFFLFTGAMYAVPLQFARFTFS